MDGLLWFLLIGLAAGWIAGQVMKKRRMGLVGNLVVGVIGLSFYGLIGSLVTAVVGAIVLLYLVGYHQESLMISLIAPKKECRAL